MLYLLKGEEFYGLIDFTLSSDNIFPAMSIFVLSRAIRFGAEYEFFTNATVGVGIFAAAFLYYDAFINYNGAIREFILPTLCLIFALLLKKLYVVLWNILTETTKSPLIPMKLLIALNSIRIFPMTFLTRTAALTANSRITITMTKTKAPRETELFLLY